MSEYDGIIIGSGHNSLVLQAYACRAGLNVICLERRDIAGGGLATMEDPRYPGFLHNTHSFYHRAITDMPWYRDLELDRHGARYLTDFLRQVREVVDEKPDRALSITVYSSPSKYDTDTDFDPIKYFQA